MRVTRVALVAGLVLLGFLCWLAAIGFTAIEEILITLFALVVLVAGGNWLSGRTTRTPGAPARSSSMEGQGEPDEHGALAEQGVLERPEAEGDAGGP